MPNVFGPIREYLPLIQGALRVLAILAGGYLLSVLAGRLFGVLQSRAMRWMVSGGQVQDLELEKRAKTVVAVVRRPALILLWAAVVMMVMQELGFRVEPLLAGAGLSAGVLGVAVGFGAQSLVKDVLAGIFMLAENQIRVNDVAVINGTGGLVEEINLRTTILRSENGAVHIFPNGSIQTLSNLTREFAYYVIEVQLRFEEDPDRVIAVLREIGDELRADAAYAPSILEPLEVMGVDRFLAAGLVVKARVKTLPQRQWLVGRELNRRVRMRFQAEGIGQPETGVLKLDAGKEAVRAAVREVLGEMGKPGAGSG